jgi:hypothetical protein
MQVTDEHYTKIVELTYPVWVRDYKQWTREVIDLTDQYPTIDTQLVLTLLSTWMVRVFYPNGTTVEELVADIRERLDWVQFKGQSLKWAAEIALGDHTCRLQGDSGIIIIGQVALISSMLQVSGDPTLTMVRGREQLLRLDDNSPVMVNLRRLLVGEAWAHAKLLEELVAAQQQGEPQ